MVRRVRQRPSSPRRARKRWCSLRRPCSTSSWPSSAAVPPRTSCCRPASVLSSTSPTRTMQHRRRRRFTVEQRTDQGGVMGASTNKQNVHRHQGLHQRAGPHGRDTEPQPRAAGVCAASLPHHGRPAAADAGPAAATVAPDHARGASINSPLAAVAALGGMLTRLADLGACIPRYGVSRRTS